MSSLAIGVDIGGTGIRSALVDPEGVIVKHHAEPTPARLGREAIVDTVLGGIHRMIAEARLLEREVQGIGVGSAGQINASSGIVEFAVDTLPDWQGTPIRGIIRDYCGHLPIWVDNDVNAIALAEQHYGAGRDYQHFICLALGTGIGGAIVESGRLVRGSFGGAGEFGHLSVQLDGPRCSCGNYGCLELYASGTGMTRLARETLQAAGHADHDELALYTSHDLLRDWQAGDALAARTMCRVVQALGTAIAGIIHIFNPQAIVIGGGVADAGEPLLAAVREAAHSRTSAKMREACAILPAAIGSQAGVIGAATQVWTDGGGSFEGGPGGMPL
ncbi:ROK family transcriptional regulator [Paenibacillus sp. 598K]|uniref:ROK family protein n=1 Tax=Paenibacillus sp. 598K TaxID=1117987 RepID=UPI000FFADC1F|nr:ROK family protein [Paenibacillus sp. 598K]GBF76844.1 ROK family transcriptional regulator [Paenibacillus sp. 598K]